MHSLRAGRILCGYVKEQIWGIAQPQQVHFGAGTCCRHLESTFHCMREVGTHLARTVDDLDAFGCMEAPNKPDVRQHLGHIWKPLVATVRPRRDRQRQHGYAALAGDRVGCAGEAHLGERCAPAVLLRRHFGRDRHVAADNRSELRHELRQLGGLALRLLHAPRLRHIPRRTHTIAAGAHATGRGCGRENCITSVVA